MKIHFTTNQNQVACGRDNHNIGVTQNVQKVTCRACRHTSTFSKALKALLSKNTEAENIVGNLPKAAWKKYLLKLPSSRLPRCIT